MRAPTQFVRVMGGCFRKRKREGRGENATQTDVSSRPSRKFERHSFVGSFLVCSGVSVGRHRCKGCLPVVSHSAASVEKPGGEGKELRLRPIRRWSERMRSFTVRTYPLFAVIFAALFAFSGGGAALLFSSGSYEPGDFMLHFAGKKGRVRLKLVDYYYPRAEKVRFGCCCRCCSTLQVNRFFLLDSVGEAEVFVLPLVHPSSFPSSVPSFCDACRCRIVFGRSSQLPYVCRT